MNLRIVARVCGLAAALAGAFLAGTWAQTQTQSPILKWPLSLEAVHAAPNVHHILFENDSVRLLEVTVQPGQTEPRHWHMYPSVFAINGVQAALTDHTDTGTTNRQRQYEDTDWSQPQCRTMPVQAPHQVTDTDSFPVHFYRLEFKKMDGKSIETNWAQYKH
ncbi:MAG TPA: hypothetical protein VJS43_12790 [Candidatus Acidoferrales bacterium]|nr:hypothetical protein [Candidatus Acidoferrales bacterium]